MVWLDIKDLPLNVWMLKAFSNIAYNWGIIVFIEEDQDENIACGRVYIKTMVKELISNVCAVDVNGVSDYFKVKESFWSPDMERQDDSQKSSCSDDLSYRKNGEE